MAAKKKAAKKAAKAKPKIVKKLKPSKAKKAVVRSPRSQVLPGMEQTRNQRLDHICEGISDVRRAINRLKGEELDLERQATVVMSEKSIPAYRQAGVELALVPGEPKLRVRLINESATAKKKAAKADADEPGVTADEIEADGQGNDGGEPEQQIAGDDANGDVDEQ